MPETSFTQVRDLQDKTTLRGVYFFLSISISLLIFKCAGFKTISFFNPVENIGVYISIISLASLLGTFFYYTQPNLYLLKCIINLRGYPNKYPEYKDVSISKSIDHLFIRNERTKFGSKLFFSITIIIIFLLFLREAFEILITAFIFTIMLMIILLYLLLQEWRELILRLKLIYFMKLFYKDNNQINQKEIDKFVNYLGKELWFEAKSSFSQFIEIHLKTVSEPYIQKLKHRDIIEKFCNFIHRYYDHRDENTRKPAHEIAQFFFNSMNLEIIEGFSRSDRFMLDFIKPIKEAIEYLLEFSEEIQKWDNWLKKFVFKTRIIDLDKIISQMKNIIKLLNKNNEYGKLESIQRQLSQEGITVEQIRTLKEDIYTQYKKIIYQISETSETLQLLNIKNFFKEDLFKEYLKKIRDKIYFFETDLKLVKRLGKENYQEVFSSVSEILKFYFKNYKTPHYQFDNDKLLQDIDLIKNYEFDLDKLDIFIDFSKTYELKFIIETDLEIIIPIRQEGLFSRRIDNLSTKNPSANLERQKKIIYEYLKKRSKDYNLKFDEEFWNK